MKRLTHNGKIVHDRRVTCHRAYENKWRKVLLPQLLLSFYWENRPPSSQRYLSAKHLPNADLIYKRLDAERNRHREITIKLSQGDSFLFVMFYKRWASRRFKNVNVQLKKDGQGDILVSWDGLAKSWKS